MSKRILVTGATGLIGRHLVRRLVNDGWDVVGLDRALDARLALLSSEIRSAATWVDGDTRDWETLLRATSRVDVIVHLAAGASFLMYEEDPLGHTANTINGFHNLLEAALRNGVPKIVYASTSAVYEGNLLPYREEMTLSPPDLKAFAKKVNEEMARMYADRYQIQSLALRPFSVYGEDEMSKGKYANVTSLFVWAMLAGEPPIVWGNGSQTRDFVHVSDVARAFLLAAKAETSVGHLNVGTGIETSFNEILSLLAKKLGVDLRPRYVPTPIGIYANRLLADTSLAREVLGFSPQVPISEGLDLIIVRGRELLGSDQWRTLGQAQSIVLRERGYAGTEFHSAQE